jgi:RNA polymerase sigma-70 factor, ECF subfamily
MSVSVPHTASATLEAPYVPRPTARRSTKSRADSSLLRDGEEDDRVNAAPNDPVDYDELYRTHHARVLRLCRLLLSDVHEAGDVTQEVFLKLFRATRPGNHAMAWGPWLTRVTVNACRDRRRAGWWKWSRQRREEIDVAELPGAGLTPEQEALGNETRRHVWRSFRELSARQQEVFVLRQLEGWSTEEVAQTLGLSSGSVKRHLYRAVHQLRTALRGPL